MNFKLSHYQEAGNFARMTHNPETTLAMAPAAGAGLGKMFFAELLAREGIVKLMVDAAVGGLHATFPRRWDPACKDWAPADPDAKTRIYTLVTLINHAEGEPIKRIIHQHLGAGGAIDPLAALQESPALLEQAERLIEKAKWRKSGRAKKVEQTKPAEGEIG